MPWTNSMTRLIILGTLTLLLCNGQLPNPQQHPQQCGRTQSSSLCDPDSHISSDSASAIDGLINLIHDGRNGFKQGSCGGNEVAVAIVSSTSGFGTEADKAKRLAKKIQNDWGVGKKECENGVVLVVVVNGRAMYVSTGRGVKDLLSTKVIECMVFNRMRGLLRKGRIGEAVERGVESIGKALAGDVKFQKAERDDDEGEGWGFLSILLVMFGIPMAIHAWWKRKDHKKYEECKRMLAKLDENRAQATENRYEVTSCPICLEDFGKDVEMKPMTGSKGSRSSVQTHEARKRINDDMVDVKLLSCGHTFHKECIDKWVDAHHYTCPVCRKDILNGSDSATSNAATPNKGRSSHERHGWDFYGPEHSFRLGRLRHYYPDYVTSSMTDRWDDRDYCGAYSQDVTFAAANPALRAAAVRSGHSGTSYTFGGGSSSGGGGHGGSW